MNKEKVEWHRRAVGARWEVGELQFKFMKSRGLLPHHHLLDIGCGSLRAGVHFIGYLDSGHYYGVDEDLELLETSRKIEIPRYGLEDKEFKLFNFSDFDFSQLGQKFDYILAHAVFPHLAPDMVELCIKEATEVLKENGEFYATFYKGKLKRGPLQRFRRKPLNRKGRYSACFYDINWFEETAERFGMKAIYLGKVEYSNRQNIIMLKKKQND